MLRASRTGTDILGTEKGGRAGCRCLYKKREVFKKLEDLSFFGRDERIRTFDLHVPNVAREPDCATSRFKSDAKIINYPDAIQTSEDFFSWGPFFLLLVCCREGTPLRGRGMPADASRVCSGRDTGKEDTDRQSVRIIRRLSSGSRFLTGKQVRRPYLRRYGESLWKNRAALLLSGG